MTRTPKHSDEVQRHISNELVRLTLTGEDNAELTQPMLDDRFWHRQQQRVRRAQKRDKKLKRKSQQRRYRHG